MDSGKKKIARNTLALYARMGIIVVVSLYTSRVVLQQLGASDFGIYNVVGGVVFMIAFLNGTLSQGVQRFLNFYSGKEDEEMMNKIFSSSLLFQFLLVVLILVVAETFGIWFIDNYLNIPENRIVAAHWVFHISIVVLTISVVQVPYMALVLSHEDMTIYAYIGIVEGILRLIIVYLLSVANFDKLIVYAILLLVIQVCVNSIYFIYCKRKYSECFFKFNRDKSVYKSLLAFSGWNVLGGSASLITVQGINIVLNIFFGTIVNAARAIAVQISSQLDSMINNVQTAMNPQIVKNYSRGDVVAMNSLLVDNFKWNFFLFWLLGLPLFLKIDCVLYIWLGEYPEYTEIFARLIIIRCLVKCIERPLISAMYAIGKMKYPNIVSSSSLFLVFVFSMVLFNWGYPPYWAFALDIFAILICITFDLFFLRVNNVLPFRLFFSQVVIPLSLIILSSSLLCYYISISVWDNFVGFILFGFGSLLVSGTLIFFLGLTKDNRKFILSKLFSKIIR